VNYSSSTVTVRVDDFSAAPVATASAASAGKRGTRATPVVLKSRKSAGVTRKRR
jgi:hypothetical protein